MTFDAEAVFLAEFDKAIAADVRSSGFPVEQWFRNGMAYPATAIEKWRTDGPEHVRQFVKWFEGSGQQVWITPDGRPAIELELRVEFGNIEVHMFIDLITIGPLGLTVIDLKSGSRPPDSLQQLAIYAGGVELQWGAAYRPLWGTFFRSRGTGPKGAKELTYYQPPVPLSEYRYSVEFFAREFAMFEQAVSSGTFVSKVSKDCERCSVAYACLAVGGTQSWLFDPADPEYNHGVSRADGDSRSAIMVTS